MWQKLLSLKPTCAPSHMSTDEWACTHRREDSITRKLCRLPFRDRHQADHVGLSHSRSRHCSCKLELVLTCEDVILYVRDKPTEICIFSWRKQKGGHGVVSVLQIVFRLKKKKTHRGVGGTLAASAKLGWILSVVISVWLMGSNPGVTRPVGEQAVAFGNWGSAERLSNNRKRSDSSHCYN